MPKVYLYGFVAFFPTFERIFLIEQLKKYDMKLKENTLEIFQHASLHLL